MNHAQCDTTKVESDYTFRMVAYMQFVVEREPERLLARLGTQNHASRLRHQ